MNEIIVIEEDGIFINKISGEVPSEDIIAHVIKNVATWKNSPVIWDLNNAVIDIRSSGEVINMIQKLKSMDKKRAGSKTAFVASENLQFGMARMYDMWHEGQGGPEIRSFRDINKAKEWLLSKE